jgi:hypothetical protein
MIRLKNIIPVLIVILMISSGCQGAIKNKEVSNKVGIEKISIDSLLTLVQYKTFQYFWDGAEPFSGMARERYHVDGIYPRTTKTLSQQEVQVLGLWPLSLA